VGRLDIGCFAGKSHLALISGNECERCDMVLHNISMSNEPNLHKLSPRDEELATMLETEFPSIWKTALEVSHGHRNVALIVRLVRRHIEVAASERERRLTEGKTDDQSKE